TVICGLGRMRRNHLIRHNHAVSEILGGILLLLIALLVFASIYMYLYPPPPDDEINVKIQGSVTEEGDAVLEHVGGDPLTNYLVIVSYPNGTKIGSKEYENTWMIGEKIYPLKDITDLKLTDEDQRLKICVYSQDRNGKTEEIFSGILQGRNIYQTQETTYGSMLISSLKTDSSDEDLICFTHTINQSLNPTSYIYKWMINGNPLNELLLPFDTENNSIAKDYSGSNNNGTVIGATWTDQGKIGGAYYFDGAGDYIETDLPPVLGDVSNNDFTISLWMKSDDIDEEQRVLWEGGTHKNFGLMFQFGGEIHFGICYNDGIQDSVRTENLTSNTWYHIVGVWDASEKQLKIYANGEPSVIPGNRTFSQGGQDTFDIGHGMASSRFWKGYIDEVQLYDRTLSDKQVYQLYLCQKNGLSNKSIIVSDETNTGETWQCIVTPNDGTTDYDPVASNILNIVSYPGGE
ncbi:MAG: hypothetical protein DRM98_04535, partial [Thermoplasmata archaeon]